MMAALLPRAGDRLLVFMVPLLTIATLAAAVEAHALCSISCIHGDRMAETEICSDRT